MKNRLYTCSLVACVRLLLAVCALNLVSCAEVGIDSQAELPLKIVTDAQPEYTILASLPRNVVFTVSSNTPWKIESDQNWCIPSPALSSAGSLIAEVTVKMEKNETEQSRTATLIIKAENMAQTQTIKIVQEAKGKLEVQPIEEIFATEGATQLFTICSNKEWTLTSSSVWLTLDKLSGEGNNVVTQINATAAANNGAKRTATLTIKSGFEERTFEVTQDGIMLELPQISLEEATFDGLGETHTYAVNANVAWKAELVDNTINWVTLNNIDEDKSLMVKAGYNTQFIKREAQIRITPKKAIPGVEGVILTIYQGQNFKTQIGSGNTITFDANGAATVNSVKGESRFVTNAKYKLGKFTWKFASFNISDDKSFFELNFWPNAADSPGQANYHVYLGLKKREFTAAGTFVWASKALDFSMW